VAPKPGQDLPTDIEQVPIYILPSVRKFQTAKLSAAQSQLSTLMTGETIHSEVSYEGKSMREILEVN
jgi:hypothetical protein